MQRSVWIGYDGREDVAFRVAVASLRRRMGRSVPVFGLYLPALRDAGLYTRPTERRDDQWFDTISAAPMSTEFAISRFLVPHLVRQTGKAGPAPRWALFTDCDVLFRADVNQLFDACRDDCAAMVVQHKHQPVDGSRKMDGVLQTAYARKNWSSVMALNVDHPSNALLTPEMVNTLPGRGLHGFSWLQDHHIGSLHPRWNYLVGHTRGVADPAIVHFTDGTPAMPGYEGCEYAPEWRAERDLDRWAA